MKFDVGAVAGDDTVFWFLAEAVSDIRNPAAAGILAYARRWPGAGSARRRGLRPL
jgi:hypothetical protein